MVYVVIGYAQDSPSKIDRIYQSEEQANKRVEELDGMITWHTAIQKTEGTEQTGINYLNEYAKKLDTFSNAGEYDWYVEEYKLY